MRPGAFIVNGVHSDELKAYIQFRPQLTTPKRKRITHSVPGVNGDYLIDENAFENTHIPLSLFIRGEDAEEVLLLSEKLTYTFNQSNYISFIPYFDKDMEYQIFCEQGPTFEFDGNYPELAICELTLSAKPFKRYTGKEKHIGKSATLMNPYLHTSRPLIKLIGTGDMTLTVNDKEFRFKNIQGYILIDSVTMNAYKDDGVIYSMNDRMYTIDFPMFRPGKNVISVSGSATGFEIEPRWVKLLI